MRDSFSIFSWAFNFLPSVVEVITRSNFRDKVLRSKEPWVVDFYMPHCMPCQQYMPEYEQVAKVCSIWKMHDTDLWFLSIFPDFLQNFFLPLFERREVATKERSSLYCVQTSSFLFVGMWRVCKSSKIKHPGGSGGFVLSTKGRPRTATHFSGFFLLLSNHTSVHSMNLYFSATFYKVNKTISETKLLLLLFCCIFSLA